MRNLVNQSTESHVEMVLLETTPGTTGNENDSALTEENLIPCRCSSSILQNASYYLLCCILTLLIELYLNHDRKMTLQLQLFFLQLLKSFSLKAARLPTSVHWTCCEHEANRLHNNAQGVRCGAASKQVQQQVFAFVALSR